MTHAIESHPIQTDLLRSTLERTFALAQAWGLVSAVNDGWQYRDEEHVLTYNPLTQALEFLNMRTNERMQWRDGQPSIQLEMTFEPQDDFTELSQWLDSQGVPQDVAIDNSPPPIAEDITSLEATAAQLFEAYAAQGIAAYKLVEDSSVHYYSVEVDGNLYILSRDDETGFYNLQKEVNDFNLQTQQGITQRDIATWTAIDQWLELQAQMPNFLPFESIRSDWEQQEQWADWVFPIAERAFAFQDMNGVVQFDQTQHHYTTAIAEYEIGYTPSTDTLWVNRGHRGILGTEEHWQPEELKNLAQRDGWFFQSLDHWLMAKNVDIVESVILKGVNRGETEDNHRDRSNNPSSGFDQVSSLDF